MQRADVIIVGGGPAGSTCAWKLRTYGIDCLLLDRARFPREKLCAGWLTPRCVHALELADYPHPLVEFRQFRIRFRNIPFALPTRQYSIRRVQFDAWLLQRAGVPVVQHRVARIERRDGGFEVDGAFRCRVLVGAGGTDCPVYRTFFRELRPREPGSRIAAIEEEFAYPWQDAACRLWFMERRLPGYAWYVPKADGMLNVGIGAECGRLRARGQNLAEHWRAFTQRLAATGCVRDHAFAHRGACYHLRQANPCVSIHNAYVIGDAAGRATRDMGEGIGPAVESGIRVAAAIRDGHTPDLQGIARLSLPALLLGRFSAGAPLHQPRVCS